MNKLPKLQQTTNQRPEDMIRDRLLSFNVKNGRLSAMDSAKSQKMITIKQRSESLAALRKS